MLLECPQCHTKFNLDDSLITPEGSWVRCSRCQEVFQTPPGGGEEEDSYSSPPLNNIPESPQKSRSRGISYDHEAMADFGLDPDPEPKPRRGLLRFLVWSLLFLLLLAGLALGAAVAMDKLHIMERLLEPLRRLPGLNLVLSPSAASDGGLSLNNVRAYYRDNQHVGRIFVIQGEVFNLSGQTQINILVQGRLNDVTNRPVRQAVIYAGPVFTPEELRELTLAEIQSHLSQPDDASGRIYELAPQGNLPFMIVLANLPDNISDYTAEVVGWEPIP
jgi:predicted Zn finger-like uncharacterized protein